MQELTDDRVKGKKDYRVEAVAGHRLLRFLRLVHAVWLAVAALHAGGGGCRGDPNTFQGGGGNGWRTAGLRDRAARRGGRLPGTHYRVSCH